MTAFIFPNEFFILHLLPKFQNHNDNFNKLL